MRAERPGWPIYGAAAVGPILCGLYAVWLGADANWDLRGTMQDLQLLYGVGRTLGGNREWPNYVEGNAFRKSEQRGQ